MVHRRHTPPRVNSSSTTFTNCLTLIGMDVPWCIEGLYTTPNSALHRCMLQGKLSEATSKCMATRKTMSASSFESTVVYPATKDIHASLVSPSPAPVRAERAQAIHAGARNVWPAYTALLPSSSSMRSSYVTITIGYTEGRRARE